MRAGSSSSAIGPEASFLPLPHMRIRLRLGAREHLKLRGNKTATPRSLAMTELDEMDYILEVVAALFFPNTHDRIAPSIAHL